MSARYPHGPADSSAVCPDCGFDLLVFDGSSDCPAALLTRIAELERAVRAASGFIAEQGWADKPRTDGHMTLMELRRVERPVRSEAS